MTTVMRERRLICAMSATAALLLAVAVAGTPAIGDDMKLDQSSPVFANNTTYLLSKARQCMRKLLMPFLAMYCLSVNHVPHVVPISLQKCIVR